MQHVGLLSIDPGINNVHSVLIYSLTKVDRDLIYSSISQHYLFPVWRYRFVSYNAFSVRLLYHCMTLTFDLLTF